MKFKTDIEQFQEKVAQKEFGELLKARPFAVGEGLYCKKGVTLRNSLLDEEVQELKGAFEANNPVEVLDAIVDILYITFGTAHEAGILHLVEKAWDLVHQNNMSKIGPSGVVEKNEQGKVIKPVGFVPVDLKTLF